MLNVWEAHSLSWDWSLLRFWASNYLQILTLSITSPTLKSHALKEPVIGLSAVLIAPLKTDRRSWNFLQASKIYLMNMQEPQFTSPTQALFCFADASARQLQVVPVQKTRWQLTPLPHAKGCDPTVHNGKNASNKQWLLSCRLRFDVIFILFIFAPLFPGHFHKDQIPWSCGALALAKQSKTLLSCIRFTFWGLFNTFEHPSIVILKPFEVAALSAPSTKGGCDFSTGAHVSF